MDDISRDQRPDDAEGRKRSRAHTRLGSRFGKGPSEWSEHEGASTEAESALFDPDGPIESEMDGSPLEAAHDRLQPAHAGQEVDSPGEGRFAPRQLRGFDEVSAMSEAFDDQESMEAVEFQGPPPPDAMLGSVRQQEPVEAFIDDVPAEPAKTAKSSKRTDELPEVPQLDDPAEIGRVACALLLSARDGLSLLKLAQACNTSQKKVRAGLDHLAKDLADAGLPLEVAVHGDMVRILTLPEVFPYLQRLRGVKKAEKLSPAALETLAVVAYRQPVFRAEIEAIRGVKAGPMLRTLLDHKLIKIAGRADVPGRPLQYGTTPEFLERFGLQSISDLPSVKEFKQLG